MPLYTLDPFGEINLKALSDYYGGTVEFGSGHLEVDLNFDEEKATAKKLETVKKMIDNLAQLDAQNKKYLLKDYESDNEKDTKEYIRHHLDELSDEELSTIIDISSDAVNKEKQLLNRLHLVRVGFYPECKEHFAVFDYTIGQELTNYLIVVNVDSRSKIHCMTQES